ncbi:hypothetical protein PCANC_19134, partial [Puccinia coronata f. sp. avenae]
MQTLSAAQSASAAIRHSPARSAAQPQSLEETDSADNPSNSRSSLAQGTDPSLLTHCQRTVSVETQLLPPRGDQTRSVIHPLAAIAGTLNLAKSRFSKDPQPNMPTHPDDTPLLPQPTPKTTPLKASVGPLTPVSNCRPAKHNLPFWVTQEPYRESNIERTDEASVPLDSLSAHQPVIKVREVIAS